MKNWNGAGWWPIARTRRHCASGWRPGPITLYAGFDPTADSLHVGNLVPLLALRRFQLLGHHPIVVAGGATGLVGDPSGKAAERQLLTRELLDANIAAVKEQLRRLARFRQHSQSRPADGQRGLDRAGQFSGFSARHRASIFLSIK